MRTIDIAQLYLRIVIGGMLLLHNIWKYQNYNDIISTYPQLEGLSGALWFTLFAALECTTALMLIAGWRVRLASVILIVGSILALTIYFPNPSINDLELKGIYIFIYIYMFIAGGGLYSMDGVRTQCKSATKE
ncbi:MAG: DoxX family membrane protein [Rikenellaceae bacterium]